METTIVYWGSIGIVEHKMETTIVFWGYIGIREMKWKLVVFLNVISMQSRKGNPIVPLSLCI